MLPPGFAAPVFNLTPVQLSDAHNQRGFANVRLQNNKKALVDFEQAIKLDDQNVAAYKNRGETFLAEADYPSAIEDFNRALALQKEDVAALVQRGQAFSAQTDMAKALSDFNQALKLDPASDQALSLIHI